MHMRIVGRSTLKNRCVNVPTRRAPVLAALFMDELRSWIALLAHSHVKISMSSPELVQKSMKVI